MRRTATIALTVSLVMTGLVACTPGGDKTTPAGQVIARVGGDALTLELMNYSLSRGGAIPENERKQAERTALERLIDQSLAVQKAVELKLDRDPRIVQALESARRQILSQAFAEKVAGSPPLADDAATRAFYEKNPALFAQRRIYELREVLVPVVPERVQEIAQAAQKSGSLDAFMGWLKTQNIHASTHLTVKPAEQLPLELLPRLSGMKDGEVAVFPAPQGLALVNLVKSQPAPLDEASAKPLITQFLSNQRRTEAIAAEMKKLREAAKIERLGEFAASTPTQGPAGASGNAGRRSSREDTRGAANQSVEKGIAGLSR